MFNDFFYQLRSQGVDVSTTEWLTLMDALRMGLHGSTLLGFYNLCRAVLCKSETEYDKFQQAFLAFFDDANLYEDGEIRDNISDQIMDYVNNPGRKGPRLIRKTAEDITDEMKNWDRAEIERKFRHRLENQKKEHNGGYIYVGTHGISPYGNSGSNDNAIRVGGASQKRTALRVAGKRDYKDFRDDNVLDIRQFQMAFRLLRRFASQDGAQEEFDVEQTIRDTSQKGGVLQIRYRKPRRNTIKVLLLMDSGGSMAPYSSLCSRLFQAASRSNRFKDLKVYYFHNCPSEYLYTNPTLERPCEVATRDVLKQCCGDYKVIFVGDATMEMGDLTYHPYKTTYLNQGFNGLDWLKQFRSQYPHTVWLNPYTRPGLLFFGDWGRTYDIISSLFNMYPLTVTGLEQAMKKLMVRT